MQYFTFQELERSDTAARLAIDNAMPEQAKKNAAALVDNVLDPLRRAWGKPIYVNSGYRCPELNKAVGGAKGSHHLSGHAADVTAGNPVDNRRLYQLAIDLGLPCYEIIGKRYNFGWLHLSHVPGRERKPPM